MERKNLIFVLAFAIFEIVYNSHLLKPFLPEVDIDTSFESPTTTILPGSTHPANDPVINPPLNQKQNTTAPRIPKTASRNADDPIVLPPQRQRPWMVVHVGPPKTATTSIQGGMEKYSPLFASADNTFYMGQRERGHEVKSVPYIDPNGNSSLIENGAFSIYPMKAFLPFPRPTFQQNLRYHHRQKHNVVISTEHYTSKFPRKKDKFYADKYFNRFFNKICMRGGPTEDLVALDPAQSNLTEEIIAGRRRLKRLKKKTESNATDDTSFVGIDTDESSSFGFDVKIVVGYRHYFQWLPSYYFQSELINHYSGAPTLIDYIEEAIHRLGSEYSVDDENSNNAWSPTIFPGLDRFHGSLYSYLRWSSPLSLRHRVEIFDLHQQKIMIPRNNETVEEEYDPNLFRDFACQVLPDTAETCSHLREVNKRVIQRVRAKSGPVSSLESGKLSDTKYRQLLSAANDRLPEREFKRKGRKDQDLPEQIGITFDVDLKKSVFKDGRHLRDFIEDNFYDWTRQRNATGANDGHRQLCLSEESTRKLRNVSWNMLRHLEFLVRLREKNNDHRPKELFSALALHRPKHPLLLSPGKYDHVDTKAYGDWWEPIKRAHDELFEETVERGAYCELDLDRLFADENFVRQVFYQHPQKNSSNDSK